MLWLYILLIIVGVFIVFLFLPTMLISNRIYSVLLVRHNKKKWSRSISWDDEEQKQMFHIGEEWGKTNEKYQSRVEIKSGKFHLVGEYFDFSSDKAVIIIPGRMESGTYSYYFAKAYQDLNYNILAIDNRCHGLSDGRYNTLGLKEYKDILKWAKFLHDEKGIRKILIHGICIGSATGLYALVSDDCPDYLEGLVADGMYTDFGESLKNHLIERKKPVFPFNNEVLFMIQCTAGKSPIKYGPIKVMPKLKKPILFIYSKQDAYSTPDKAQELYDACHAPKRLVWFEKGVHSHVRINATEKYDQTIKDFVGDFLNE